MRVNAYIDGFNLYYGCLKKTPYKWLDPKQMCEFLIPQNTTLQKIKYFTARVSARPNDPGIRIRQQTYLRALNTIPNLQIIEGHFLSHPVKMPNAKPPPQFVEVIKTEEKGSDVNLASHLLRDAFTGQFDIAVVVTNDSDLYTPIEFTIQYAKLPVLILSPYKQPSAKLKQIATLIKPIREGVLKNSQFPAMLTDANGTFSKPITW
jgi:hypothetical protein